MAPRINLHIGYNKTGSSSIQAMLASNRQRLASANLHYPETGLLNNAHYVFSSLILGYPQLKIPNPSSLEKFFEELVDETCQLADDDEIVLSSEYMCCSNDSHIAIVSSWLGQAFPNSPVRIIVYLRPHDEWFTSCFNQTEKIYNHGIGSQYDPNVYSYAISCLASGFPSSNYLGVIDLWAKYFGIENVVVRSFHRSALLGGCVCDDFLSLFDVSTFDISKPRVNESLTDDLLLLAIVWNRVAGTNLPMHLCQRSNRITAEPRIEPNNGSDMLARMIKEIHLTKNQRLSILNLFRAMYAEIGEKYLAGGSLFGDS